MSDVTNVAAPQPATARYRKLAIGGAALFGALLVIGVVPRLLARWELGAAVEEAALAPPRVPVAKPHPAEPIRLELPGSTLAYQQSTLYGRVSGYLDRRLVDIGDRVKAGDSDQHVIDWMVARYGNFIRLRPPFNAHTLLLWLAPVLAVGICVITVLLSRYRRPVLVAPLTSEERGRLAKLIQP